MKNFIHKYRRIILLTISVWTVLVFLFLINSAFSLSTVSEFVDEVKSKKINSETEINWNNPELRELFKEKLWLENQVALAKSNSFSLGINLKDSLVQVQLKGTILFQSKILNQKPPQFFGSTGKDAYLKSFSEITVIDSSISNIPRKPIKKVAAPQLGAEVEVRKPDSLKTDRIRWEFVTENQIRIIINGAYLAEDSTQFEIPVTKDMLAYRFNNAIKNSLSHSYMPTLFLWLNDGEAKAIYRALPDNAEIIFRN